MNNKQITIIVIALVAVLGLSAYFLVNKNTKDVNPNDGSLVLENSFDPKNAPFTIEGISIKLTNGIHEMEAAPGSASKITTKYFGNEARGDIDGDGTEDIAFLLTQETGGSGTYFYAAALLNKATGPVSVIPLFIGDRIAPQTTEYREGKVIVNYAERNIGESFDVAPSLGKSLFLKLDTDSMQFGEVVQNFEGEVDFSKMNLQMKTWNWVTTTYNNDTVVTPKKPDAFTITFTNDNRFSATTDCNRINGEYTTERNGLKFSKMLSTRMYCEGSQENDFQKMLNETGNYMFTPKGELVLELKMDTGSVIFK